MKTKPFLILLLVVTTVTSIYAQAPIIKYTAKPVYYLGKAISTLKPTNTGGVVPAQIYGNVTTFAGSQAAGKVNGTGTAATFSGPFGVATDVLGNVYVADRNNNLIRKITAAGVVSTFAGSGVAGSVNGTAAAASFNKPYGIAVDAAGNLFVTETGSNLIRKITPAGVVTTIAGSGAAGRVNGTGAAASFNQPNAIAVDAAGNLYVADTGNNLIRKITAAGVVTTFAGSGLNSAVNGTGTAAAFWSPTGIGIDKAGNVYVADENNELIRKITPAGVVSTLAGNTLGGLPADGTGAAAAFKNPSGLAVDAIGNIYVSDTGNPQIRVVTPAGVVTTLAGSGFLGTADDTGATASFYTPAGLAVDKNRNLFVADWYKNVIRKITTLGYAISPALPPGLKFDGTTGIISGLPAVARLATTYTIKAFNANGSSTTSISFAVNAAPAPVISYAGPQSYVAGKAIAPLTPANTGGAVPINLYGQVSTFAGTGVKGAVNGSKATASFNQPFGITLDAGGNMFVSEMGNRMIRKITPAGIVSTLAGSGSSGANNGTGAAASFNAPGGMVTDAAGNIFVADIDNNMIRKITPAGVVTTFAGSGYPWTTDGMGTQAAFNHPAGITVDKAGNFFVTDYLNRKIRTITPTGLVRTLQLSALVIPENVAVDNDGHIYDTDALTIKKITELDDMELSPVTSFAGSGVQGTADGTGAAASFGGPSGIIFDSANNLYITDRNNNKIRKITPTGVVTTLAGMFDLYDGPKNGPGAIATFGNPAGITIDAAGNLYIADTGYNLIRKVSTTGYIVSPALPDGLTIDGKGTITGTPTAATPAKAYTITAYNAGGSSKAIVNIGVVKQSQIISFAALNKVVYGSADVTPVASSNSALPVALASSNTKVATVVSGKIHITGAGTATITASQPGNTAYLAADPVLQLLTVSPAALSIKADNKVKSYGAVNPVLTVTGTGFVKGENVTNLTTQPVIATAAITSSPAGSYPIKVSGASSTNYSITYVTGILTVNAVAKTANLVKADTAITTAGTTDWASKPNNITNSFAAAGKMTPYPNPCVSTLNINLGEDYAKKSTIAIYDLNNKTVYSNNYSNSLGVVQINVSDLKNGLYVLKVFTGKQQTIFKILKN